MAERSDRKDFREDLGSALSTELTGGSGSVQDVYDHDETDLDGSSPVICLGVTGSTPIKMTVGAYRYVHHIDLLLYVVRSDDPEAADDTLDAVYQDIAEWLEANQTTSDWKRLGFEGRSVVTPQTMGGEDYWLETIPLTVEGY